MNGPFELLLQQENGYEYFIMEVGEILYSDKEHSSHDIFKGMKLRIALGGHLLRFLGVCDNIPPFDVYYKETAEVVRNLIPPLLSKNTELLSVIDFFLQELYIVDEEAKALAFFDYKHIKVLVSQPSYTRNWGNPTAFHLHMLHEDLLTQKQKEIDKLIYLKEFDLFPLEIKQKIVCYYKEAMIEQIEKKSFRKC